MYKNILIATDGSDFAQRALEQGLELANELNARVTAVLVTEPWVEVFSGEAVLAYPQDEYEREMTSRAAHGLGVLTERAAALGIACETIHVRDQQTAFFVLPMNGAVI